MKNENKPDFAAHYNELTGRYQGAEDHLRETADIAAGKTELPELKNIIKLTAMLHDMGKMSLEWQKMLDQSIAGTYSGPKLDHSTAGGQLAEKISPGSVLAQMVQGAIYSHHGLQDFVSVRDSSSLFVNRRKKAEELPIRECEANFYRYFSEEEIEALCKMAAADSTTIKKCIQDVLKGWGQAGVYGNKDFFLGMYERILISLLIDSDRRNTEDFARAKEEKKTPAEESSVDMESRELWESCSRNVEHKIESYRNIGKIAQYRREISESCLKASERDDRIFQLTVPTGAGKTLSSLRFAVHYAKKHNRKHIIYIAPFHSIIEQNAREIREALGRDDIVLEHHCNILVETEKEQEIYDRMTEDWDVPVVVSSAVQFLNTLFAAKTGSVRRMHSLCNSVIIVDEVQALPLRTFELFNMAMNFLTTFANTTLVLCTATQPLLDELPENRLLPPGYMVEDSAYYQKEMKRTEIVDCTDQYPGGMTAEQLAEFALEQAEKYRKVLVIVNTKACARKVFEQLRKIGGDECCLAHLSTRMCPKNRNEVLESVKQGLTEEKMQICVSTQLVEAGVDISFRCVIRSLAGLDSVIQAAGRCNRHMEEEIGKVFLVKLEEKLEDVSKISDIYKAQEAMQSVLALFRQNPQSLNGTLDSQKAIARYFQLFLSKRSGELCYTMAVEDVTTSMVELLSGNSQFAQGQRQLLKQAFKTAGEKFEAIEDMGKTDVITIYEDGVEEEIMQLESPDTSVKSKKRILRKLQQYTISLSGAEIKKVKGGITNRWNGQLLILDKRYYDKDLGVIESPKPMESLLL